MLTLKVTCIPLVLLLLRFDGSESVARSTNERSYQSFYPFGYDAQDSFLHLSGGSCSIAASSQYDIFQERPLFVSFQININLLNVSMYCIFRAVV